MKICIFISMYSKHEWERIWNIYGRKLAFRSNFPGDNRIWDTSSQLFVSNICRSEIVSFFQRWRNKAIFEFNGVLGAKKPKVRFCRHPVFCLLDGYLQTYIYMWMRLKLTFEGWCCPSGMPRVLASSLRFTFYNNICN